MADDAGILQKLAEGDVRGAVDGVYRLHARNLRAFLRNRMYSEESVEEVMSEIFQSLMTDLPGFRGNAKLKTWLRSVTQHAMLRYFQREHKRRQRQRPLEPEDENRPTPQNLRHTLKQWLAQIYSRLDDDDKKLVDFWAEGWSWQEVAERTGTTEEGVRKRFTRLMKRLQLADE